jgi:ribosomal protein L11 methyltransferase
MPWISAALTVSAASVEAVSDALLAAGALCIDVADARAGTAAESAMYGEPGVPRAREWDLSTVKALFAEHADVAASVAAALRAAGLDCTQAFDVERIADQDWVRATQNQFQPVHVSPRLWVVPSWHAPPDAAAINLFIDPGLAFGTGTHATTRLCLQWLDANLRGGERVLDYGCGSGILAIAAMKLGAGGASGVDIDPAAVLAARNNAMQNEVMVEFFAADRSAPPAADIVLANILANPLVVLAPLLAHATRPGGRIVLAGVLDHQASEVEAAYRAWFHMHTVRHDDGWALLAGSKR